MDEHAENLQTNAPTEHNQINAPTENIQIDENIHIYEHDGNLKKNEAMEQNQSTITVQIDEHTENSQMIEQTKNLHLNEPTEQVQINKPADNVKTDKPTESGDELTKNIQIVEPLENIQGSKNEKISSSTVKSDVTESPKDNDKTSQSGASSEIVKTTVETPVTFIHVFKHPSCYKEFVPSWLKKPENLTTATDSGSGSKKPENLTTATDSGSGSKKPENLTTATESGSGSKKPENLTTATDSGSGSKKPENLTTATDSGSGSGSADSENASLQTGSSSSILSTGAPDQVDDMTIFSSKEAASLPVLREHGPHSLLATIESLLVILEAMLAGPDYMCKSTNSPTNPLLLRNTVYSVRAALETLLVYFEYIDQHLFEPTISILREFIMPVNELVSAIKPDLNASVMDYYPPILQNSSPEPVTPVVTELIEPNFVITPREVNGTTIFEHHHVPAPVNTTSPRIPLYMNVFHDPNLGVFATADGFIRLELPYDFQIDLTIDQAICVNNLKDGTLATISGCGMYSGILTGLAKVHQHGKVVEICITDEFDDKKMYAKIGVKHISIGGTNTSSNMQLKEDGETISIETPFSDLDQEFIKPVFVENSTNGPEYYEACCNAIRESTTKTLLDGSLHFYWRGIKISQYVNGEVTVIRKNGDFLLWSRPETKNPYSGAEKKGMIKVVSPFCRVVSTVNTNPQKHHEEFVLANLLNQWVYFNYRDFIISNETHSVGYNEEKDDDEGSVDERSDN